MTQEIREGDETEQQLYSTNPEVVQREMFDLLTGVAGRVRNGEYTTTHRAVNLAVGLLFVAGDRMVNTAGGREITGDDADLKQLAALEDSAAELIEFSNAGYYRGPIIRELPPTNEYLRTLHELVDERKVATDVFAPETMAQLIEGGAALLSRLVKEGKVGDALVPYFAEKLHVLKMVNEQP